MQSFTKNRPAAFTLIELLCAMAVLAVLFVLLFSILGGASAAIQYSGQRQETTSQLRSVFGCLGTDLAGQIRRPDISYGYSLSDPAADTPGNDELTFYTAATALDGDRGTTLVSYRVNGSGQLERGTAGLAWNGASPAFLGESEIGEIHNHLPKIPSSSFQVVAPRVLRFEVSFLTRNPTTSKVTLEPFPPVHNADLLALVVAIAALDGDSGTKIGEAAIRQIASLLPDPVSGEEPMDAWRRVLNDPAFPQKAGVPRSVISQIRIQQRYFPLP